MGRLDGSVVARHRWLRAGAALALAAMLAGCGGLADVGSAVMSGGEAVSTIVKKAMNDEDAGKDAAGDKPE